VSDRTLADPVLSLSLGVKGTVAAYRSIPQPMASSDQKEVRNRISASTGNLSNITPQPGFAPTARNFPACSIRIVPHIRSWRFIWGLMVLAKMPPMRPRRATLNQTMRLVA